MLTVTNWELSIALLEAAADEVPVSADDAGATLLLAVADDELLPQLAAATATRSAEAINPAILLDFFMFLPLV
jgi:hypothetical protein